MAGSRSGRGRLGRVDGYTVIPIAYGTTARNTARNRCPAHETKLSLLLLDLWRGSDDSSSSSGRLGSLFVRLSHTSGFARLSTGTEFIEAVWAWSEVGAFIKTTFVADDLAWVEGGTAP